MGMTMPITKHNCLVQTPADLPRMVLQCFLIAASGRPGPVLVDIPRDIAQTETEFEFPEQVTLRSGKVPPSVPSPNQIAAAAHKLVADGALGIVGSIGAIECTVDHADWERPTGSACAWCWMRPCPNWMKAITTRW